MHIVTLPPHQLKQLARRKPIVYADDAYLTPPTAQTAISATPGHGAPTAASSAASSAAPARLDSALVARTVRETSWPAVLVSAFISRLFGSADAQPHGAIRHWE